MYKQNELIEQFIKQVTLEKPEIRIGYEFDSEEALYHIWHTYPRIFDDSEMREYFSRLMYTHFVQNSFEEYYISFDPERLIENNSYETFSVAIDIAKLTCAFTEMRKCAASIIKEAFTPIIAPLQGLGLVMKMVNQLDEDEKEMVIDMDLNQALPIVEEMVKNKQKWQLEHRQQKTIKKNDDWLLAA